MSLKLRTCILVLIVTGVLSKVSGRNLFLAFAEQTTVSKARATTEPATKGYNKGDRLSDERMSTRKLHPPEEKKKSKPKKTAPAAAKHDLKKSN